MQVFRAVTVVTLAGHVIVGGWVSFTVTLDVQLEVRDVSTDIARIAFDPPTDPTSVAAPVVRLIV